MLYGSNYFKEEFMSLIPPCKFNQYSALRKKKQQPEALKEMTFTCYSRVSIFKDIFFTMDHLYVSCTGGGNC